VSLSAPRRILVTRSEPGASETAARLRAAGFEPIVEPLFAITPVDAELPCPPADKENRSG
jgi:uroporphyrinogen-III synthase